LYVSAGTFDTKILRRYFLPIFRIKLSHQISAREKLMVTVYLLHPQILSHSQEKAKRGEKSRIHAADGE